MAIVVEGEVLYLDGHVVVSREPGPDMYRAPYDLLERPQVEPEAYLGIRFKYRHHPEQDQEVRRIVQAQVVEP